MKNRTLATDYIRRSSARLKAVRVLFAEASYADVVREAQEIVELCLKAVLRTHGIEPARVHDVSEQIEELKLKGSLSVESNLLLDQLGTASRTLRRDRELAFYGGEDFTPGEFYKRDDGTAAMEFAEKALDAAQTLMKL